MRAASLGENTQRITASAFTWPACATLVWMSPPGEKVSERRGSTFRSRNAFSTTSFPVRPNSVVSVISTMRRYFRTLTK